MSLQWYPGHMTKARRELAARMTTQDLVVEVLEEGRCAQALHVGPFSEEGPVIEELHATLEGAGLALAGEHHEIYLSDFRRATPEKLRTILLQNYVLLMV